jgi:hypothetical protein
MKRHIEQYFDTTNSSEQFTPRLDFGQSLTVMPFGLANAKPAVLIVPPTITLLSGSCFLTSHSNRFAVSLQHLNLAKLR